MPKVLLIDDSAFMRKIARDFLEQGGFEVEDFVPQAALDVIQKIQEVKPDLILSDFNMPRVDGLEVARLARRAGPAIPVVMLTANRDPAMAALLKTTGVRRILQKPINGEDLVAALKEVLSMTRG